MTTAQTEARAVDTAVVEAIHALRLEQPGRAYDILVAAIKATLAAKNAEIAALKKQVEELTAERDAATISGWKAAIDCASYAAANTYGPRVDPATAPSGRSLKGVSVGIARIYQSDCFDWLAQQPPASIHAVVTDPPYGLVEYTAKETEKLRAGKGGGVWRVPPSFDGHQRAPLPRFTTLTDSDRQNMHVFFKRLGLMISRVAVPGANVIVASNPLLAHIVGGAMAEAGLELRGYLARQVMTMRGGDRPKNAHEEFEDVSVMPRSQWEPWVILRTPLDGRVQDNLRRWGTGGFRRVSKDRPFGDMIRSHPTPAAEKKLAPHPSLKPQGFMRQVVRASLPLGTGVILDPFMGGGSTIAAANAIGYQSIGIEMDKLFFAMAKKSIPKLALLDVKDAE